MEERKRNIIIGKAGGTSGKGTLNFKISLPSPWLKDMGVDPDDKEVMITYDEESKQIIIKKV